MVRFLELETAVLLSSQSNHLMEAYFHSIHTKLIFTYPANENTTLQVLHYH